MLEDLIRRLRARFGASVRLRVEIDDEIRTHLELHVDDLVARGFSPAAARREAERRFGDLDDARRRLYASARRSEERVRLSTWLDSLHLDLTTALRRIRATPAFAAVSVATFALGIGLTTTMFAVVDATVLRSLPYPEPDELVALYSVGDDLDPFEQVSSTNWLDWKEQNRSLAATALYALDRVGVASGPETARVEGAYVGGAFFEVLRAPMLVGRPMSEREADERAPVAVVSESLWRRFLAADPTLGELSIGGVKRQVVGVVAAEHAFPQRTEVWVPAIYRRLAGAARNNIGWLSIARLAPGVAVDQARTDLDRIAEGIRTAEPEAAYSWGVGVIPLKQHVVGGTDDTVGLLMGAVIFVLLVACANLAGQAYARALTNVEGAAVRLAIGATRWRVLQHQMIEHVTLALAGGAVGVPVSTAAAGWLRSRELPLPRADLITVDLRVLGFALGVSLLAGLLAGLAPALRVSRAEPRAAMTSVRGAAGGGRAATASALVGAEIALSVLLLIGGGLLVRNFVEFAGRDLGFDPDRVLAAEIELAGPEYEDPARRVAFWDRLLEELRAAPGVASAAVATEVPGLDRSGYGFIALTDRPELDSPAATYRVVSEDFFATMRLPLMAGRDFSDLDIRGSERVVVVSRAFADTYWPRADPLGRTVRAISMEWTLGQEPLSVIGVVGDIDSGVGLESRPAMYVLYRQVPFWTETLVLSTRAAAGEATALTSTLRERLRALDPTLAAEIAPMRAHLSSAVALNRLVMTLLNGFALLALALAALGVHGLLSFAVTRRTREIAVRAALGADRRRILGMVLGSALRVALVGSALGAAGAWFLAGRLQSILTAFESRDPSTFVIVTVTLIAVTMLAASIPALRALRLDPSTALRSD